MPIFKCNPLITTVDSTHRFILLPKVPCKSTSEKKSVYLNLCSSDVKYCTNSSDGSVYLMRNSKWKQNVFVATRDVFNLGLELLQWIDHVGILFCCRSFVRTFSAKLLNTTQNPSGDDSFFTSTISHLGWNLFEYSIFKCVMTDQKLTKTRIKRQVEHKFVVTLNFFWPFLTVNCQFMCAMSNK